LAVLFSQTSVSSGHGGGPVVWSVVPLEPPVLPTGSVVEPVVPGPVVVAVEAVVVSGPVEAVVDEVPAVVEVPTVGSVVVGAVVGDSVVAGLDVEPVCEPTLVLPDDSVERPESSPQPASSAARAAEERRPEERMAALVSRRAARAEGPRACGRAGARP